MNGIDQIQEALKSDNESPIQLASYLTQLAGWNSYYTEMLKKIQLLKPSKWLEIQSYQGRYGKNITTGEQVEFSDDALNPREKPLSDKKTEMTWASTEDGQKETALTYELKRIAILYQSINRRLYALEQEYRQSKSAI